MNAEKMNAAASGFSMVECVLIVGIIAMLAAMAVPALMTIVPQAQLRGSARGTANLLQRARLMADNSQRPIRLSLTPCRSLPAPNDRQCQNDDQVVARLHSAVFKAGAATPGESLSAWAEVAGAGRTLARDVRLSPDPDSKPVAGSPDGLFWAVFLPNGRVFASHGPAWRLIFKSTNSRVKPWELSLNLASGRPTLKGLQ